MFGRVAMFGAAAAGAAAVGAAAWVAVGAGPQRQPNATPRPSPAPQSSTIVCAGGDGILRAAAGPACPAGQTRVPLVAQAQAFACADCDPFDRNAPASPPDQSDPALDALARRIDKLLKWSRFEVVKKSGETIFKVSRGSAKLYNSSGDLVAGMQAGDLGGYFMGLSADHERTATIGASGQRAGVLLDENAITRVDLGVREAGNASLILPNISGPTVAIGQSRAGSGALIVGDHLGRKVASVIVAEDKGMFGGFNAAGAALFSLGEGASGGLLVVGDDASEPVVKMGVQSDRYGVVLTGPKAGLPYVPRSGLPGSYFFGCASCQ